MGNVESYVTRISFTNTYQETLWVSVTSESTRLQNLVDNSHRDVPWYNRQRFMQRIGPGGRVTFDIELCPNENMIYINGGNETRDLEINKSLHKRVTPCDVSVLEDGKLEIRGKNRPTEDATWCGWLLICWYCIIAAFCRLYNASRNFLTWS